MRSRQTILPARGLALVWVLLLLALSAWLALRLSSAPALEANLMSLLPAVERDPVVEAAADRFRQRFEHRVVVLVGASDLAKAQTAAETLSQSLLATGQFRELTHRYDEDLLAQAAAFYLPLRFGLLSDTARQQIVAGDLKAFERAILSRYFAPMSGVTSDLIERDPLQLLPAFLEERASGSSAKLDLKDGFLVARQDGKVFALLSGTLADSPFSFALQDRLMPAFESFAAQNQSQQSDVTIVKAGVVFHAASGTATAKQEISRVGLGALLGIVLLFAVVFRSWLPLGLSLLSIAVGCLGGFITCLALFGEVHLLTLVFGASLVGISVDYSLHYFCDRFRLNESWSPQAALNHVFPGITLGLVTSVIGFAGLLLAPFPGMRQMAVFSSSGLVFAYICVLTIHPLVRGASTTQHMMGPLNWSAAYVRFCGQFRNRRSWPVLAALLFLGAFGISRLEPQDDIRQLQSADVGVLEEEHRARELMGENYASQFFLVEGQNEAELLAREERLVQALRRYREDGHLTGYVALSDFVPSPARQAENRALLAPLIEGERSLLRQVAERIGLPDSAVDRYVDAFAQAPQPLANSLSDWLASPMARPYRHLWLGSPGERAISAIGLQGVSHPHELRRLSDPDQGVTFVDNVGELSSLFGEIRRQAGWLTLASYAVVTVVLFLRYGLSGGLAVMAAPIAAAYASLGVQGLIGEPVSLFTILALLLVLGIGVDYGIFFRESGADSPSTLIAIALSAVTTVLAFGLLAFSSTTAVHTFGLTIMIGICVALLLSPVAGLRQLEGGRET